MIVKPNLKDIVIFRLRDNPCLSFDFDSGRIEGLPINKMLIGFVGKLKANYCYVKAILEFHPISETREKIGITLCNHDMIYYRDIIAINPHKEDSNDSEMFKDMSDSLKNQILTFADLSKNWEIVEKRKK